MQYPCSRFPVYDLAAQGRHALGSEPQFPEGAVSRCCRMWHGSILLRQLISGLCFPPSFPPPHHCAQHPWALFHDSNLPRTVLACHCDVLSSLPSGCYNGAKFGFCCQSFDPIPRRNLFGGTKKSMTDAYHARETDLEPSGIAGTMRFLDSADGSFMMTNNTVFDYP